MLKLKEKFLNGILLKIKAEPEIASKYQYLHASIHKN
jgi:hypothetical protein